MLYSYGCKKAEWVSAQSLEREVLIWKNLNHKNVLLFLGMAVIDGIPCTVSKWMENGTMVNYLENHANVDVLALVRRFTSD